MSNDVSSIYNNYYLEIVSIEFLMYLIISILLNINFSAYISFIFIVTYRRLCVYIRWRQ